MDQKFIPAALCAMTLALPAFSWDLPSIISKVSDNCNKITRYSADAAVRYKI